MNEDVQKLDNELFGTDRSDAHGEATLLKQYEIFVGTSEALAARRQGVNTFFLSVNSIVLAAAGLLFGARDSSKPELSGLESGALIALGYAGVVLCLVWRRLITSFRQLSQGKFKVIHALERRLAARVFTAEWWALGEGEDKKKYIPFTRAEKVTPIVFLLVQFAVIGAGLYTFAQ